MKKGNQTERQHSAWPRVLGLRWQHCVNHTKSYPLLGPINVEKFSIWKNVETICFANVAALAIHRARLPSFGPSPFKVLDNTDNDTIRCPDIAYRTALSP